MACQPGKGFAVQAGGEVSAHRVLALFVQVVDLAPAVEFGHGVVQHLRFFCREQAGEKQVTVAVKLDELVGGQFHRLSPWDVAFGEGNAVKCREMARGVEGVGQQARKA